MPGYRVEYAGSGRAKCIGKKPCKGSSIGKGQIRFGTWVSVQEHGVFKWRHWGCLTSSVLTNVANELDNQIEDLDGFEDLKPEDQIKVKKAFETLAIDPADIPPTAVPEKSQDPTTELETKGEGDVNPKKRKRAPAKKKAKPSDVVNDNDENQGPEDATEPKPTKKKREKKVTEGKKKKIVSQED